MRRRLSLSSFYHFSWVGLLTLAALQGVMGELLPLPLQGLAWGAALWCLVPKGRFRYLPPPTALARVVLISAQWVPLIWLMKRHWDAATGIGGVLWGVLVLLLPRKQKTFGHWLAVLVTALIALLSVIINQEFGPHLLFLVFLTNLIFTLNANNLYSLTGPAGSIQYSLNRRYFRQLVPALGWGVLGGGLVFFLFPRTHGFSNPWGLKERENTTGYTGKVTLDGSNRIGEDETVALTVESQDVDWLRLNASRLFFRGNTLERFDGKRWYSAGSLKWPYDLAMDVRYTRTSARRRIALRLFREPHSTLSVLYPEVLLNARLPGNIVGPVYWDASGSLYRGLPGTLRYAYEVVVEPAPTAETVTDISLKELAEEVKDAGDSQRDPYRFHVQVPREVRESEYFKRWVQEVDGGGMAPTVGRVLSHLRFYFLSGGYQATLVHEQKDRAPLESFLTTNRRGHCEYFATASAMYLRSKGIPARLVAGYRGGRFNELSQTLEVLERDAHAWVEVYAGKGRWLRFDPTPMILNLSGESVLASFSKAANAVRFWFNRYVVQYDTAAQQQVLAQIALWRARQARGASPWKLVGMVVLPLLAAGLLLVGFRRWRSRRHQEVFSHWPDYYELFLRRLNRLGLAPEPGETLSAFHRRLEEWGLSPFPLRRLETSIHQDLYAARPSSPQEQASLLGLVRGLVLEKEMAGTPRKG